MTITGDHEANLSGWTWPAIRLIGEDDRPNLVLALPARFRTEILPPHAPVQPGTLIAMRSAAHL